MIVLMATHGYNFENEISFSPKPNEKIAINIKMNIGTNKESDYDNQLTIDEAEDIVLALQIAISNAKLKTQ
jgi:hypothetical protein